MLDPGRTVLVEGGDTRLRRNEFGACLVGGRLDELDNGLLGRALVPGGQRVCLRLRVDAKGEERQSARADHTKAWTDVIEASFHRRTSQITRGAYCRRRNVCRRRWRTGRSRQKRTPRGGAGLSLYARFTRLVAWVIKVGLLGCDAGSGKTQTIRMLIDAACRQHLSVCIFDFKSDYCDPSFVDPLDIKVIDAR